MNPIPLTTQAIILCGGKGTRLSSLYSDRPKILVPIAGRPFLEWQLEWLGRAGITDIHLAAGFKAEVLAAYVAGGQGSTSAQRAAADESGFRVQPDHGTRSRMEQSAKIGDTPRTPNTEHRITGVASHMPVGTMQVSHYTFHVSLSSETAPLGTGGGLKFVEPWIRSDPFLVLNGDSLSPSLDFEALMKAHRGGDTAAPCAARPSPAITIAVSHIDEAGRYGTVEFDETGRVTAFREKAQRESGWINAGVYLVDRAVLAAIPVGQPRSIETDIFPDLVRRGSVRACPIAPPMLDMGTPDGIKAMEDYLKKAES